MRTSAFLQKLTRSETEVFLELEHAGEVLGIFKAEEVGGFCDGLPVVQKSDGSCMIFTINMHENEGHLKAIHIFG